MPIREYSCESCKTITERIEKWDEHHQTAKCSKCGMEASLNPYSLIAGFSIQNFKNGQPTGE